MKTLLKNGEKDIADLLEQDMKEEGVWYEYINDSKKTTNSTAPTATPETTPKLNEPATSGELTFDDGGTLGIMLFEENDIRTATGLVNFNGESPEAELERILAAMYLFSELNIENYHIMGMSGDDYLMLVREDGKYDEVLTHIPESLSKLHDGSEFPDDSTNRIFAIVVDITEALICPFSHIRARVLALSGQ